MAEGDTIHRLARRMHGALAGKPALRVDAPRARAQMPAAGTTIEAVEARGKNLLVRFSDGRSLLTHMRMTGSWHLYAPEERWRKPPSHARAVIETADAVAVCFSAPVVEIVDARRSARLSALGPDLCMPDADLAEAVARFALLDAHTTIAEALLDQRIACGVGNIYKSETLWACSVAPFRAVGEVDESTRTELLRTAARLLQRNLVGGRRVTVDGGLAVYRRAGRACKRCGARIRVAKAGALPRVTYWCPECQRG